MNKVLLLGKLSFDPDVRKSANGLTICNFSLATEEKNFRKDAQEKQHYEFHRVVVFGKTAESCARFLRKGSTVFVEGRVKTEAYEKDGTKMKATKIIADDIKFIGASELQREETRNDYPDDVPF